MAKMRLSPRRTFLLPLFTTSTLLLGFSGLWSGTLVRTKSNESILQQHLENFVQESNIASTSLVKTHEGGGTRRAVSRTRISTVKNAISSSAKDSIDKANARLTGMAHDNRRHLNQAAQHALKELKDRVRKMSSREPQGSSPQAASRKEEQVEMVVKSKTNSAETVFVNSTTPNKKDLQTMQRNASLLVAKPGQVIWRGGDSGALEKLTQNASSIQKRDTNKHLSQRASPAVATTELPLGLPHYLLQEPTHHACDGKRAILLIQSGDQGAVRVSARRQIHEEEFLPYVKSFNQNGGETLRFAKNGHRGPKSTSRHRETIQLFGRLIIGMFSKSASIIEPTQRYCVTS